MPYVRKVNRPTATPHLFFLPRGFHDFGNREARQKAPHCNQPQRQSSVTPVMGKVSKTPPKKTGGCISGNGVSRKALAYRAQTVGLANPSGRCQSCVAYGDETFPSQRCGPRAWARRPVRRAQQGTGAWQGLAATLSVHGVRSRVKWGMATVGDY